MANPEDPELSISAKTNLQEFDQKRTKAISLVVILALCMLALPFTLLGWAAHGIWIARKQKSIPTSAIPQQTQSPPPSPSASGTPSQSQPNPITNSTTSPTTSPTPDTLRQAAETTANQYFGHIWKLSEIQSPLKSLQLELDPDDARQLVEELLRISHENPTAAVELQPDQGQFAHFLIRPEELSDSPIIEHLKNTPGWSEQELMYLDIIVK
ncbi:MAG: hypothetical protein N2035_01770 [Chthoniobacterales bacterium]|nr:hypothetical protein [Chthoniobacterales bacterium]